MRLTRTIPLTNVLGGRTAVDLILDVENLFNYTGAVSFFAATRSPDQDGFNLNRRLSDLTSGVYYRPEETFRGYQEYVSMVIARRGNYQFPRRVFFAVSFRF
jgi:hypothetical protein